MAALAVVFRVSIKPDPKDNTVADENPWTLIFAGSADIDENNLVALLDHWLPVDLEVSPPVIQAAVRGNVLGGLSKVHAYLADQFGADAIQHVPSVIDYITTIQPGPDQYLVVLWGDGGDEETEKLVDQACRLGITVLDLTDGLEEFTLDSKPPEEEIQSMSRATRRVTGTIAAAAAVEDTPAPEAEEDTVETLAISPELVDRVVAHVLHRALAAALKELEETPGGTAAGNVAAVSASTRRRVDASDDATDSGSSHPVEATPGRRYRASDNVEQPAGTKRYAVDPETSGFKRMRGRPRSDAVFVFLTPDQEREFGLLEDAPF